MNIIYLDNAATTCVAPEVERAMAPMWSEIYGNAASRFHPYGWAAEEIVSQARQTVETQLGAHTQEVVFTSGASESIQLIFLGWLEHGGHHLVLPATEHSVVLDLAKWVSRLGKKVTFLPVDQQGNLSFDLRLPTKPDLFLLMAGNNEIGTCHPVGDWVKIIRDQYPTCWIATDATQAVGKYPVNFHEMGVDFLVGSAHKFHGPKGVGFLLVRQGLPFFPWGKSHRQERGRRAGTLAVPLIAGLAAALELDSRVKEIEGLRNKLEEKLLNEINVGWVNGNMNFRLPHISSITFPGIDGERLFQRITKVAVSNGSACTSAEVIPSHVLKAIGLTDADAEATVRFSLSRYTTESEIDDTVVHMTEVVNRLRK